MPAQKLLDHVRSACRLRHFSVNTEDAYTFWIRKFVAFHNMRHPNELGEEDIRKFLSFLAVNEHVSASTQNQALNAIVFLYNRVLMKHLGAFGSYVRAYRTSRLPAVFSPEEARLVINALGGMFQLIAKLLYGSGLRLQEALRLRVKDADIPGGRIVVRDAKGGKDRITLLPVSVIAQLRLQIKRVRVIHQLDCTAGFGEASMPDAFERKHPSAAKDFHWQYVFPASQRSRVPGSEKVRRHHIHASAVQRAVKNAIRTARIPKHASCHTFRHSFATHMLEQGCDIRKVQALLGHRSVKTTMVYIHTAGSALAGLMSPLDMKRNSADMEEGESRLKADGSGITFPVLL